MQIKCFASCIQSNSKTTKSRKTAHTVAPLNVSQNKCLHIFWVLHGPCVSVLANAMQCEKWERYACCQCKAPAKLRHRCLHKFWSCVSSQAPSSVVTCKVLYTMLLCACTSCSPVTFYTVVNMLIFVHMGNFFHSFLTHCCWKQQCVTCSYQKSQVSFSASIGKAIMCASHHYREFVVCEKKTFDYCFTMSCGRQPDYCQPHIRSSAATLCLSFRCDPSRCKILVLFFFQNYWSSSGGREDANRYAGTLI